MKFVRNIRLWPILENLEKFFELPKLLQFSEMWQKIHKKVSSQLKTAKMLWINIFNSLFLLFWLEEFHWRTFPTVTFVKSLKIKKCRKVLIIAKNALSKQGIIEFLKNGEILKISRNIWIKYRKVRKFFDANTNLEIGKNSYLWKICKFRKHSEISEK